MAAGTGFINGNGKQAVPFFRKSGLDNATLGKIWVLADVGKDNMLNVQEFCIAFVSSFL